MTNEVFIDGDTDAIQLRVQGVENQSEPLQTWEDYTGQALAQVASDGRLQVGNLSVDAPDALIEANNKVSPSGLQRGLQSLGKIAGTISDAVAWAVYELELLGSESVSGLHTAFRSKLTNKNSVDADQAELRAGDFEAINEGGTVSNPVGIMTGVQSAVTNESGAYLEKAIGVNIRIADEGTLEDVYGLKIEDVDQGTDVNFAIHTGKGTVHLGDHVALAALTDPPSTNPNSGALIYSKSSDNRLYARTAADGEYVIGSGGGAEDLSDLTDVSSATPSDGQALVWNDSNSLWEPGDVASSSGAEYLADLSDVSGQTPLNGQALAWDSTSSLWKPKAVNGARQQIIRNNGASYTTSSTSFVPIDSTNLKCVLTTNGGDVLVWFTGTFDHSADARLGLDIRVDGTTCVGDGYGYGLGETVIDYSQMVSLQVIILGLSAGTHTFEIMWRTSTATLYLLSDTNNANDSRNVPVIFGAMEIG